MPSPPHQDFLSEHADEIESILADLERRRLERRDTGSIDNQLQQQQQDEMDSNKNSSIDDTGSSDNVQARVSSLSASQSVQLRYENPMVVSSQYVHWFVGRSLRMDETETLSEVSLRLDNVLYFILPRDTTLYNLVDVIHEQVVEWPTRSSRSTERFISTTHTGRQRISISAKFRKMMRSVIAFYTMNRVQVSQDMLDVLSIGRNR